MPRKTPEAQAEQIIELKKQGKSRREIQALTKASPPTISRYLKEAGLTDPSRKFGAKSARTPASVASDPARATVEPAHATTAPSSSGNGLDEYQPPPAPKKAPAKAYGRCEACNALHEYEAGKPPAACEACGDPF